MGKFDSYLEHSTGIGIVVLMIVLVCVVMLVRMSMAISAIGCRGVLIFINIFRLYILS